MLTNTVVLFLRDLLPMFIMFAYLSVIHKHFYRQTSRRTSMITLSLLLSVLILFFYESISDLFEGTGIEWLKIVFVSFAFICFLLTHIKGMNFAKYYLLSIASLLLLIVHLNSFLLYFTIYFANTDLIFELLIGCAIGIGICVSFYFLFSFFIQELWLSKYNFVVLFLWSLFVANQLSLVTNFLHQIDIIAFGTERLVDLTGWINEDSEYGFIVKALTGFDVTPSVFYSLLIGASFTLMFSLSMYNKQALLEDYR
jgi:high-affinity iron transporter